MPNDPLHLICYSVNLAFIVVNLYSWLLKRFFVPEAYKANATELYPAQRAVAGFYLLQLFEIPYLLMVGRPEALFYVNGTGLLVFSSFILVMVRKYFFLQQAPLGQRLLFLLPVWLCWVAMLGDYALWCGGKDFLKARLPGMRHTLHLILNHVSEDGTLENLPGWSFQDWVEEWDMYGNAPGGRHGAGALNSLLCLYALDSAIRVETFAGDETMAEHWKAKKRSLAQAVMAKYWCEARGLIADTAARDRFSKHSQCLALLAGILPPDRERRVLNGLLEDKSLARTTVYFSHYLFDVYMKYGRTDLFLKRLDLWREYVNMGLKTPLEAPGVRARSDCHAWGSHPIYHLLTGVAGIRPAANEFASVRIAPQPGPLKKIQASMPTPKGIVSVDLRFDGSRPTGTVTLPDGLQGTFQWNGTDVELTNGTNVISFPRQ